MLTAIFLGVVIALVITVVVFYNKIVNNRNAVKRSWSTVLTYERQKNKVLPHVETLLNEHKGFEESVLTSLTELRSSIEKLGDDAGVADVEKAEAEMKRLMQGLRVSVENYPELKSAELYQSVMQEISKQQGNIAAALQIFNQNVEIFNNGIQEFPNNLVNRWLNKENEMKTFSDTVAEEGFEFTPKT